MWAQASVLLSLEMLKITNAIREYQGDTEDPEVSIMRAVYDEQKELEANFKAQAVREMSIYGMVYKRGHKRKNWQMRLFVLVSRPPTLPILLDSWHHGHLYILGCCTLSMAFVYLARVLASWLLHIVDGLSCFASPPLRYAF